MTATVAERRVKKELQKLRKDPLDGMSVEVGASATEWFVTIVGEWGEEGSVLPYTRVCFGALVLRVRRWIFPLFLRTISQ